MLHFEIYDKPLLNLMNMQSPNWHQDPDNDLAFLYPVSDANDVHGTKFVSEKSIFLSWGYNSGVIIQEWLTGCHQSGTSGKKMSDAAAV